MNQELKDHLDEIKIIAERTETKVTRFWAKLEEIEQKVGSSLERLVTLERIVAAAIPRSRRTKSAQTIVYTPKELTAKRVAEMTRIFDRLVSLPSSKRKRQNFPACIVEGLVDEARGAFFGAVPESILANRCSMLKIFQPLVVFNEKSAAENAYDTIKEANRLGVVRVDTISNAAIEKDRNADDSAIYHESDARIVMSKDCAARLYGRSAVIESAVTSGGYCDECDEMLSLCVCEFRKTGVVEPKKPEKEKNIIERVKEYAAKEKALGNRSAAGKEIEL